MPMALPTAMQMVRRTAHPWVTPTAQLSATQWGPPLETPLVS